MSMCAQSAMQRKPTSAHKHGAGALRRSGVKAECECAECAKKKGVLQRKVLAEQGSDLVGDVKADNETTQGPLGKYSAADVDALAAMLVGEARGEGEKGMIAVAWIAVNRTLSNYNNYGESLQSQLSEPKQFKGYTPDSTKLLNSDTREMKKISPETRRIARGVLQGSIPNPIGDRTDFRGPNNHGKLSPIKGKTDAIRFGKHVFYSNNKKSSKKLKKLREDQLKHQKPVLPPRLGANPTDRENLAAAGWDSEPETVQLQRAATAEPASEHVPEIVYDVLRSSGQLLDRETRKFMEGRFNHDFSAVRIHTDDRAAESARAVNAKAYTVGRDVVFDRNAPSTSTIGGRALLAHELAHVVQQGARAFDRGSQIQIGRNATFEQEAIEAERTVPMGIGRTKLHQGLGLYRRAYDTENTKSTPAAKKALEPSETDLVEAGFVALAQILYESGSAIEPFRNMYGEGRAANLQLIAYLKNRGVPENYIARTVSMLREKLAYDVREKSGAFLKKAAESVDNVRGTRRVTYDILKAMGRSDAQIIESAARTDKFFNALPGGLKSAGKLSWATAAGISIYVVFDAPPEKRIIVAKKEAGGLVGSALGTMGAEAACIPLGLVTSGIGLLLCGALILVGGVAGMEGARWLTGGSSTEGASQ